MNIAVVGACGKLGSLIVAELQNNNYIVTPIDLKLHNSLLDYNNINAVIDASQPDASLCCAKYCSSKSLPLLIACTGHSSSQLKQIDCLCKNIAYCVCSNLSIGIAFIMQALSHLTMLPKKYISITDIHHIHKKDSPSGTALALKKQIELHGGNNVSIVSLRQAEVVGTHIINITLPNEEITIKHTANNRNIFATGANLAITKLLTLPKGKYNIADLLGE